MTPAPGNCPITGLLKLREKGIAASICYQCVETLDISLLVTGFATPGDTFAANVRQLTRQLTASKQA